MIRHAAPQLDLEKANDLLEALIDKHEQNVELAQGFGARLASRTAALPKNLMPLKQAQQIVANFDKDTAQIKKFIDGLPPLISAPVGMEKEFEALYKKARETLFKFEYDKKVAQEALEKYEDLLVGQHFQDAFEAVRHAVLDFDLADDADVDFQTKMFLDASPSYALGQVILKTGTTAKMVLSVKYTADSDVYDGSIKDVARGKTFDKVVSKVGATRLPAFVRELTEQAKAYADAKALGLFKSRKKIELKLIDLEVYKAPLTEAVKQAAKGIYGHDPQNLVIKMESATKATASFDYNGYGWTEKIVVGNVQWKIKSSEEKRKALNAVQSGALPNGAQWTSKGLDEPWSYRSRYQERGPGVVDYKNYEGFLAKLPELMDPKVYGMSAGDLRKMAVKYGVDPSGIGATLASKSGAIDAMLAKKGLNNYVNDFRLFSGEVKWDITISPPSKKASAKHVAQRFLTAGADEFGNFVRNPDVGRAFAEAREEAGFSRGRGGYSGSIVEKSSYKVRKQEPMTIKEAQEFADKDVDSNDKWGPAYAVPVAEEKVLKKEMVTVTVEAHDEADAKKRGVIKIKATGRIPPDATILVDVKKIELKSQSPRVKIFDVTGERRASITGKITGWYFYGFASS